VLRLFIAIDLPEWLTRDLARLRADIPGAAWVKPTAMHLTLRFLGDAIEPEAVEPLVAALAGVHAPAFSLLAQGVGRFPPGTRQAARVLWAGVADVHTGREPDALHDLFARVEAATTALGYPRESQHYHPHITLARLKTYRDAPAVARFLSEHAHYASDVFTARAIHLISSVLTPQGPRYHTLHSTALAAP
jgi:2'-5' RNA ligase